VSGAAHFSNTANDNKFYLKLSKALEKGDEFLPHERPV
jgi:hypothetical protein